VYLAASGPDYHYSKDETPIWKDIEDNDVVRIWDVHGVNPPSSNSLENFWNNVLVLIDGGGNNSRIAWGPHPSFNATNYKIYRAVSTAPTNPRFLTFDLIRITNSTTYEYIDTEFVIGGTITHYAWYYVKAYNSSSDTYSSASNKVNTSGEFIPYKMAFENPEETQASGFSLNQNYPNPFNPATMIQFSIKNKSFASLKIYDILGNEVAVLIENFLEAGNHSIDFNASNLPSGIYMYRLQTDEISLTKKMILLK